MVFANVVFGADVILGNIKDRRRGRENTYVVDIACSYDWNLDGKKKVLATMERGYCIVCGYILLYRFFAAKKRTDYSFVKRKVLCYPMCRRLGDGTIAADHGEIYLERLYRGIYQRYCRSRGQYCL